MFVKYQYNKYMLVQLEKLHIANRTSFHLVDPDKWNRDWQVSMGMLKSALEECY